MLSEVISIIVVEEFAPQKRHMCTQLGERHDREAKEAGGLNANTSQKHSECLAKDILMWNIGYPILGRI